MILNVSEIQGRIGGDYVEAYATNLERIRDQFAAKNIRVEPFHYYGGPVAYSEPARWVKNQVYYPELAAFLDALIADIREKAAIVREQQGGLPAQTKEFREYINELKENTKWLRSLVNIRQNTVLPAMRETE